VHIPNLILKLYVFIWFLTRVISVMTGKMVSFFIRAMESTKHLSIIFQ